MRLRRPKERETAEFNLTPMIDLVLNLIVFFMLTAQFARATLSPIDLPKEVGEPLQSRSEHAVVVDIDEEGRMSLFGRRLALEAVVAEVRREVQAAGSDNIDVYVRAHRRCPAAFPGRLARELARAGVPTWKIATNPPEGTP